MKTESDTAVLETPVVAHVNRIADLQREVAATETARSPHRLTSDTEMELVIKLELEIARIRDSAKAHLISELPARFGVSNLAEVVALLQEGTKTVAELTRHPRRRKRLRAFITPIKRAAILKAMRAKRHNVSRISERFAISRQTAYAILKNADKAAQSGVVIPPVTP